VSPASILREKKKRDPNSGRLLRTGMLCKALRASLSFAMRLARLSSSLYYEMYSEYFALSREKSRANAALYRGPEGPCRKTLLIEHLPTAVRTLRRLPSSLLSHILKSRSKYSSWDGEHRYSQNRSKGSHEFYHWGDRSHISIADCRERGNAAPRRMDYAEIGVMLRFK
jgi:hypothetical protein